MNNSVLERKNKINVIKYRWLWLTFSLALIIPAIAIMIYSMVIYPNHAPLRLGLDFTGGTMLQYGFNKEIKDTDVSLLRENLTKIGITNPIIQTEQKSGKITQEEKTVQQKNTDIKTVVSIRTKFLSSQGENNETIKVNNVVKQTMGEYIPLQTSAIGPTLGKELFKNAMIALLLCFFGIVGYLTVRFNIDFAICALIALFHDAIFVCGAFSLLGLLFGTEIDSLFITAILTVIGFSVHDTIVVFDRIRENAKYLSKKKSFNEIVNISVNQTLARSINTSLTIFITLLALYFFGGSTTKDFVLAMTLGIVIGTYSSIFNASVLLAMWRENEAKLSTTPA
ncbi:MAG: protein-export membrane protein SecF [Candidatus Melainabacteria bacterium GWF2_32_7]|nr:MAG: protein-export membrane protein SecF [Candidatus Melainabacteria bacterium GWF2_32_7]